MPAAIASLTSCMASSRYKVVGVKVVEEGRRGDRGVVERGGGETGGVVERRNVR